MAAIVDRIVAKPELELTPADMRDLLRIATLPSAQRPDMPDPGTLSDIYHYRHLDAPGSRSWHDTNNDGIKDNQLGDSARAWVAQIRDARS